MLKIHNANLYNNKDMSCLRQPEVHQGSLRQPEVHQGSRCTSGGAYVPCIYTHAGELLSAAQVFVVVLVLRILSAN